MRKILIALAAALTLTGCATETGAPSSGPPPMPSTTPPANPTTAPSAPISQTVKVPDVVGKNHQLGQDIMQAAGLYNLREEDATGAGRLLLIDRNWIVVRQSPKAGAQVSTDTVVTLYSKKIGE